MGGFAAVPSKPGWSLPLVYYHTTADDGAAKSFEIDGRVTVGLKARADLCMTAPICSNYSCCPPRPWRTWGQSKMPRADLL